MCAEMRREVPSKGLRREVPKAEICAEKCSKQQIAQRGLPSSDWRKDSREVRQAEICAKRSPQRRNVCRGLLHTRIYTERRPELGFAPSAAPQQTFAHRGAEARICTKRCPKQVFACRDATSRLLRRGRPSKKFRRQMPLAKLCAPEQLQAKICTSRRSN